MPRPISPGLTDHELSIMKVLWNEAPLSVQNILDRLLREPKPAYTSLLTAVQAMEKKGFIKHRKAGKAFQYSPVLKKSNYEKSALRKLLSHVFDDDAFHLTVNIIKSEKLSNSEIKELKNLLEQL